MFWVMEIDELNFYVAEPQELRESPNVEKCMGSIVSQHKNVINEAGFGTFFEALSNHKTHDYKDLQLLLALVERFWDTTCTFHFSNIGELMLTPYDFFVITGLRLGGKQTLVNDSLTSTELKKFLGVMPSGMRSNNGLLSWLCESIPQCETVAKGSHMFMLLFIETFLCPDLGSTVNLRYLGSLRKIEHPQNYDWGAWPMLL